MLYKQEAKPIQKENKQLKKNFGDKVSLNGFRSKKKETQNERKNKNKRNERKNERKK
jgi:hypothetical protein